MTKTTDDLDNKFKKSIIDDLNKESNWIFNIQALLLFATSFEILPTEFVEKRWSFSLIKYHDLKTFQKL
ncbi:hypothetical protein SDC49_05110 [Lactobacillus sp. R2/2]|nr:hypothetical protein [Lactobacillus sp. R2/2]